MPLGDYLRLSHLTLRPNFLLTKHAPTLKPCNPEFEAFKLRVTRLQTPSAK